MLSASSARSCLLLLLSTAALLLAAAVEDVRYSVHAGLHYRAVRKVLATTAGHANFSVDLTAPIAVPLQTLLGEFEVGPPSVAFGVRSRAELQYRLRSSRCTRRRCCWCTPRSSTRPSATCRR